MRPFLDVHLLHIHLKPNFVQHIFEGVTEKNIV